MCAKKSCELFLSLHCAIHILPQAPSYEHRAEHSTRQVVRHNYPRRTVLYTGHPDDQTALLLQGITLGNGLHL